MRTPRSLFPILTVTLTVLSCLAASPQSNWQGKPYQQWTKSEVEQILTDSPWAQTVSPNSPTSGITPDPALTVRLRSALAIRQAILRLRQLREKYDQMSDEKKAAFDEKNKPLIECPACPENYIVSVVPPPGGRLSLPRNFLSLPDDKIRVFVQLTNEKGERREFVHYGRPSSMHGEAVFFFSRNNEKGGPLLTPSSKRLVLTIGREILGDDILNRYEFDVSKLIIDGNVDF